MKIIVISDLHLGNGGGYDIFAGADALPAMLAAEKPDQLIINGDGVDFLLDDEPIDGIDVDRAVQQAKAIVAHSRAVLAAIGKVPEVVVRLGNHDVELALPAVQTVFREAVGEHVEFVLGDETKPLIHLNGVKILVTHGEHCDGNNRLQYRRLQTSIGRFRYPFGSHVVKRGLNPFKRDQKARFADLIKPDVQGGALTTALIYPGDAALALYEEFPGLVFEKLRTLATSGRTFADLDVNTAPSKGRVLRWLAGRRGERFFDTTPTEAELNEVDRLIAKFKCHAVIMGHSHAARFVGGRQPYINTGTWIPLIRMPSAEDPVEAWTLFLDELKADPELRGVAAKHVATRFTAAIVTQKDRGVELALIEWKDGARHRLGATQINRGRVPAVHARIPARLCFPFMADEFGAPFSARGVEPPADAPVEEPPRERIVRDVALGPGHDENSVHDKHWGIIVAEPQAKAIVDALAPLIALREAQMGEPVKVFALPDGVGVTWSGAQRWMAANWLDLDHDERPDYLLIAGDLDAVPMAIHRVFAREAFLGRIAFTRPDRSPDLDGYRTYAEKVVRHHQARIERRPDVLLYQVDDGSDATWLAQKALIEPASRHLAGAHKRFAEVTHLASSGFGMPTPDELLGAPGLDAANILLTASHGVAARSDTTRMAIQGAMSFGREHLRAEDLETGTFLPGGLWIYVACFGAGTPNQSAFAPWLKRLFPNGGEAKQVQATLSARPFIAALPQAALRNPEGPLGMIAHLDLAWSYGLIEPVVPRTQREPHHRLTDVIARLGMRRTTTEATSFGLAMQKITRTVGRFDGANADTRTYHDRPARNAAWMARNDLEGYVLLGDPAARLPVGRMAD